VSGHTYFDYYDRVQATEANEKGLNGFEMRRLYLTYDYAVKSRYKVRVRLEANDGALALQPKAVSGARLDKDKLAGLDAGASMFTVLVKDAYDNGIRRLMRLSRCIRRSFSASSPLLPMAALRRTRGSIARWRRPSST
jgi:hypothetical protein